ncbi:MAG: EbhA [Clostridiales bacterium]|nr:EbhA [Clostridiales bacterium]
MKRQIVLCLTIVLAFSNVGCKKKDTRPLEEANNAVASYNQKATEYNASIQSFNEIANQIEKVNTDLQSYIDEAQKVINNGEIAFDESTLGELKNVIVSVSNSKVSVPERLNQYELLTFDSEADKETLENLISKANQGSQEIASKRIPEMPSVPDYSEEIGELIEAKDNYEKSIQSLKQITAPSDEFVMQRLQRVDTITVIDHVTEDNDPNGHLNKQGGYIGTVYFADSQVDWSKLFIKEGKDDVISVGTDGGGAIEIYSNVEDATKRDEYLAIFDGGILAPGSHYVYGTCIIRTSDELTASQQNELTKKILEALIAID